MTDREKLYELRGFVETEMVTPKERERNHIGNIIYYFDGNDYFTFEIVGSCEVVVTINSIRLDQNSKNFTLTVDDFIEDFKVTLSETTKKTVWD